MNRTHKKHQGFSVIMAVFIIVVLSMLAAAMLKITSAGSESVAREIISARALMAAESGAQWKLNKIFPPGGVTDRDECLNPTPYPSFGGLEGCSNVSVEVTCTVVTVPPVNYFTITSQGSCGPIGDAAVRVVEVQARDGL